MPVSPVEAVKPQPAPATQVKTINWVIGPPENIGWAYGNNAERLAKRLSGYKHVVSSDQPADIAVYFDALVAERYPVKARKSVLRIGGPRPLDRLFGSDEEAMRKALSKFDAIIALIEPLCICGHCACTDNVRNPIPNAQTWPSGIRRSASARSMRRLPSALLPAPNPRPKRRSKAIRLPRAHPERVGAAILFTTKGGKQIPHDPA